jgi:hypothetical protein
MDKTMVVFPLRKLNFSSTSVDEAPVLSDEK